MVGIDRQTLISELQSFSNVYENIVGSLNKITKTIYKRLEVSSKSDDDNIDDLQSDEDDFDFNMSADYDYDMKDQNNSKQTQTISKGKYIHRTYIYDSYKIYNNTFWLFVY